MLLFRQSDGTLRNSDENDDDSVSNYAVAVAGRM